jgi:hypothetical protein
MLHSFSKTTADLHGSVLMVMKKDPRGSAVKYIWDCFKHAESAALGETPSLSVTPFPRTSVA